MKVLKWFLLVITGMWIIRLICISVDNSTRDMIRSIASPEDYKEWNKNYHGLHWTFKQNIINL